MYLPDLQGWYIVTYALGIYILSLFLEFLTPKIDPSALQSEGKMSPKKITLNGVLVFWFKVSFYFQAA